MTKTKEQQAEDNLRLIYYVIKRNAARLTCFKIDEESAFSAGLVGLAVAINDYDEVTTPVEFFRFAYHKIWDAIFNSSKRGRNQIRAGLLRVKEKFYQRTGRTFSNEQLVNLLGVTKNFPKVLRDHLRKTETIHYENSEDGEARGVTLANFRVPLPEDAGTLNNEYLVETINEIINDGTILDDNERKVLKLNFGIGVPRCFTLREITKLLALTQKATSDCLKNGLEKLSANSRLKVLAETEV